MNWEILTNSKLIENLGWTLVHSVWQIVLIAFILFLVLQISNKHSANARYLFAVATLGFAFVLPLATFVQFADDSAQNQFSEKFFTAETSNLLKNEAQPPENFTLSANDKLQTANLPDENVFLSFANLQKHFKQNLVSALPMFVLLWIFGVGIFAFRLCGGVWQLHTYKTRGVLLPNKHWEERFSVLCGKLRIVQTVKLLQSNRIETPVVVGWLKPLILVPSSVFLQMNPQQLETILAHELIHIRRYDNLVNFAQSFVEILFFYHPCVWWISAVIRREREFACDDAVTETPGNPHIVYASALANLEEIRRLTKEKTPSFSMAASGGKLMQRINRILEKNTERQNPKQSLWSASLAFLLISAVVFSVFWTDSGFDVNAQVKTRDKKMAIGFVSIPPLDRMENPPKDADATARLIITKLAQYKIPAIGFVLGGAVSDGENFIRCGQTSCVCGVTRDSKSASAVTNTFGFTIRLMKIMSPMPKKTRRLSDRFWRKKTCRCAISVIRF
jgi:beta-lactamase regulating signal transducer with metallopeptidase domain